MRGRDGGGGEVCCAGKSRRQFVTGLHEDRPELEGCGLWWLISFIMALLILLFFCAGFLGSLLILVKVPIGMRRLYDHSSLPLHS